MVKVGKLKAEGCEMGKDMSYEKQRAHQPRSGSFTSMHAMRDRFLGCAGVPTLVCASSSARTCRLSFRASRSV